jgi:hypothetical protein
MARSALSTPATGTDSRRMGRLPLSPYMDRPDDDASATVEGAHRPRRPVSDSRRNIPHGTGPGADSLRRGLTLPAMTDELGAIVGELADAGLSPLA